MTYLARSIPRHLRRRRERRCTLWSISGSDLQAEAVTVLRGNGCRLRRRRPESMGPFCRPAAFIRRTGVVTFLGISWGSYGSADAGSQR
jgi:hypothetical protein